MQALAARGVNEAWPKRQLRYSLEDERLERFQVWPESWQRVCGDSQIECEFGSAKGVEYVGGLSRKVVREISFGLRNTGSLSIYVCSVLGGFIFTAQEIVVSSFKVNSQIIIPPQHRNEWRATSCIYLIGHRVSGAKVPAAND